MILDKFITAVKDGQRTFATAVLMEVVREIEGMRDDAAQYDVWKDCETARKAMDRRIDALEDRIRALEGVVQP